MRIVQLNPFHFPYMGGIEHRTHEISKRLGSKHEVIVLTSRLPGTAEEEIMDGYRVVRLPSRFITNYNPPYVVTPGVLEALGSLEADLVDFHYRWAPSYSRAMKKYRGRWMFTFHNTYGEGDGAARSLSHMNDALFCRMIRDRRTVCVSEFVRDDLLNRGFRRDLTDVVSLGVDMYDGPTSEEDFILFTGRLVATKGVRYLIEAMRTVDSKLVIMGKGPEEKRLRSLAEQSGVGGRVVFTGHVSEEEKVRLMSSCKIFAMPSLFESFGLATAEVMAYGKPVVASKVGGLPEVVGDGGILVAPASPRDIAAALDRLLRDDGLRHDLGRRARKHIGRFNWDSIAAQTERIYLEEVEKYGAEMPR